MTSNLPPNDPKVINDIVDKLKKQGIFDKFRKDCLADVDTRPAYQNLRQRVEVFVRRFLSNKKWTPELNKNKLRESLRKEITQAPMLSTGVGHIVEQVVNPKIYKVFKPEIDAVVCEFLGIDLHEREEKIRLRRELQRQQRQQELAQQQLDRESNANFNTMGVQAQQFSDGQNFGASSLPNMMDMAFNMSTMGPNMNLASAMGQNIPNQLAQTMQPNQLFPNMPPTMPNFALPPPGFGTTPHLPFNFTLPPPGPSQVPGSYAGMQQDFSTSSSFPQVPAMPNMSYADQINMMTSMASELQPSIPGYSMQGLTSMSTMASTMTSTLSSEQTIATQASVSMEGVGMTVMTQSSASSEQVPKYETSEDKKIPEKKEREKKKDPEPLTVEDLLNIPLPHKQQHSTKSKDVKKTDTYKDKHRDRREIGRSSGGSPIMGQSKRDSSKSDRREDWKSESRSYSESDRRADKKSDSRSYSDSRQDRGRYDEGGRNHRDNKDYRDSKDYRESKSYRDGRDYRDSKDHREKDFKDQRDSKDYKDREQREDRSNKDDRDNSENSVSAKSVVKSETRKEEAPPKPPEPKPTSEQPKVYQFSWDNMDQGDISDVSISSVHTSDLSSFDEQTDVESGLEDISSDELKSEEEPIEEEPPVVEVTKPRPRKLIALQYNYSDSEDEETREERKARIAHEKEERYMRRQHRRAELEAKRKGRDEEKRRSEIAKKEPCRDEAGLSVPAPPDKEPESPKTEEKVRPRRTKEALKEQLREKKREKKVKEMVMDKRMALRRQRKRNSKYMSEEFTSIFTDKKQVLSNEGYVEVTAPAHDAGYSDFTQGVHMEPQSPSTPTQDEVEYSAPDNEVTVTTESAAIPVYDKSLLTHMTRSRSKQVQEDHTQGEQQSAGRPSTPFSDISDTSKTSVGEVRGRRQGRRRTMSGRQTPEPEEKKPARSKSPEEASRRLNQRYDPLDLYKPRLSWRRARSPAPPVPPMDLSTLCMETDVKKNAESERAQSQRYDDSDLYKPHTSYRSRRRGASPVAKETTFNRSRSPSPSRSMSPGDRHGYAVRRGGRPPSPSQVRPVSPARGQQASPIRARPASPSRAVPPSSVRGRPPSPPTKEDLRLAGPSPRYAGSDGYRPHVQPQRGPRYQSHNPMDRAPGKFQAQVSPDRSAIKFPSRTAAASPECSAKFAGHPSPECSSTKSGSDDGSDRRPRRPLDKVDFGEAEKHIRRQRSLRDFGEAAWRVGAVGQGPGGQGGRWPGQGPGGRGQSPGGRGQSPGGRGQGPGGWNQGSSGRGQNIQRPYRRGGSSPRGDHHSFRGGFQRERFHRGPHGPGGPSTPERGPHGPGGPSTPERGPHGPGGPPTPERDFQSGWGRHRSLSSQEDEDRPVLLKPKSLEEEKEEWESISDEDDNLGDDFDGNLQSPTAENDSGSGASVSHHDSFTSQGTSVKSQPQEAQDKVAPRSTSDCMDEVKDSHKQDLAISDTPPVPVPDKPHPTEIREFPRPGQSPPEPRKRSHSRSLSPESHRLSMPYSPARPRTPPEQVRPMSPPMGEPISSPESGEVGDFESPSEKVTGRSAASRSLTPPSHDEEPSHSPQAPLSPAELQEHSESSGLASLMTSREPLHQQLPSPPAPREPRRQSASHMERSIRGGRGGSRDARRHPAIQPIPERETRASMAARHAAAMPMTRSSRRRSEDEGRPPAKRLRR